MRKYINRNGVDITAFIKDSENEISMKNKTGYDAPTQTKKNIAWFLPRPKPDKYKGGMPLYCEDWLIDLGHTLLFETGYYSLEKGNHKDEPKILNLFCGMNKQGFRIDIRDEVTPDIVCDAHSFADKINGRRFNLIIADPPYSEKEAIELYGTKKLNYKKWTRECDKVLEEGGLLVVYHKNVMPNPNPEKYTVVKRVFIGNRTGHLPRVAIYFRKKPSSETKDKRSVATKFNQGDGAKEQKK